MPTIYLENKSQIGKVDEILGPLNEVYFTVKLNEGIVATSFQLNDKVFIGEDKLLPLERFLPKPPAPKKGKVNNCFYQVSFNNYLNYFFSILIVIKKKPLGRNREYCYFFN